MDDSTDQVRLVPLSEAQDVLTDVLRRGAQQLLAQAVEAEVADWIDRRQDCRDSDGLRQVVRNGHLPQRTLTTGLGPVAVQQPRVHDRRPAERREKFSSTILPPYLRKTKSIEELIPWLYLKGVSSGDFSEALAALLGPQAKGLSATTVTRLKSIWEKEYQEWSRRSLAGKQYVYVWADGVYFNIRLEGGRQCILVLMGATADGKKELIAIQDGQRESEQSWKELLLDVQARGLSVEPKLAIGDGALGFWKALRQISPATGGQRCWGASTANVLDKLPKRASSPKPSRCCTRFTCSPGRVGANKATRSLRCEAMRRSTQGDGVLGQGPHGVVVAVLRFPGGALAAPANDERDRERVGDGAAAHGEDQGIGDAQYFSACLTMVFKLMESASRRWRVLNGSGLLNDVLKGTVFVDGIKNEDAA